VAGFKPALLRQTPVCEMFSGSFATAHGMTAGAGFETRPYINPIRTQLTTRFRAAYDRNAHRVSSPRSSYGLQSEA